MARELYHLSEVSLNIETRYGPKQVTLFEADVDVSLDADCEAGFFVHKMYAAGINVREAYFGQSYRSDETFYADAIVKHLEHPNIKRDVLAFLEARRDRGRDPDAAYQLAREVA